jgi:flagellar hook-associated protein 2
MAVTVNTSGLMTTSGFDVQGLVDQMIQAAQAPEQIWKRQQAALTAQTTALTSLSSKLASLHTSVESLTDILGAFAARTASSSDESVITATAGTSAATGQHSVTVTSLATKAVYYSTTSVATGDTVLAGGSITLQVGSNAKQIAIGGDTNTLNKLASKINSLSMGINASVMTDSSGARLALVSSATGKANDITVTATQDSALAFHKSIDAADAVATIDGIPVTSASNELTNVLTGLTLQLNSQQPDTAVTITIAEDTGRVAQAVSSFVNSYNALTAAINAQFSYDQSSGTAGTLSGDSAVRMLQERLMQAVGATKVSTSNTPTLRSLGITMKDDGSLSVDSAALNSALQSQFADVQIFFQDTKLGFATKLGALMNSLTDSVKGPFVVDLKSISDQQKTLTNTISDFEDRLIFQRQQLVEQMSQVNALLQELPNTQNQLDAMLGSLSTSSKK